jgi:hypothetical protein
VRSLRFAVVLIILYVACVSLHGQGGQTVIVHEVPLHARHFAGTVVDSKGMTVKYATVELRDPKDHHVLASTFADGNGFFSFDDKKYGKRVEIRAFQKNFNVAQYTVMRRPFGDVHIRLVLTAAT